MSVSQQFLGTRYPQPWSLRWVYQTCRCTKSHHVSDFDLSIDQLDFFVGTFRWYLAWMMTFVDELHSELMCLSQKVMPHFWNQDSQPIEVGSYVGEASSVLEVCIIYQSIQIKPRLCDPFATNLLGQGLENWTSILWWWVMKKELLDIEGLSSVERKMPTYHIMHGAIPDDEPI